MFYLYTTFWAGFTCNNRLHLYFKQGLEHLSGSYCTKTVTDQSVPEHCVLNKSRRAEYTKLPYCCL